MFRKALVIGALLALGGTLYAGPFFQRRSCPGGSCLAPAAHSPTFTTPLREYKQEAPPVQQPWLQTLEEVVLSSQQPDTVLGPIEGTGSRLLIGPKLPDKITHTLDGPVMTKVEALLAALSKKPEPVSISLPLEDSTSQRLSRILMILEALLYVVPGAWGLSKAGPFLQLVARVVSGLPSALKEPSPVPAATLAAPSSIQASGS